MTRSAALAIVLALWLAILGQASAGLRLAEQLHQLGLNNGVSSASAEQHQQGHCLSGELTAQCGQLHGGFAVQLPLLPPVAAPQSAIISDEWLQPCRRLYPIRAPPHSQIPS